MKVLQFQGNSLTRLPELSVHLNVSVAIGRSSLLGNQLKISDVCKILFRKYLLLTEFEVRIESYGPSFFPFDFLFKSLVRFSKQFRKI